VPRRTALATAVQSSGGGGTECGAAVLRRTTTHHDRRPSRERPPPPLGWQCQGGVRVHDAPQLDQGIRVRVRLRQAPPQPRRNQVLHNARNRGAHRVGKSLVSAAHTHATCGISSKLDRERPRWVGPAAADLGVEAAAGCREEAARLGQNAIVHHALAVVQGPLVRRRCMQVQPDQRRVLAMHVAIGLKSERLSDEMQSRGQPANAVPTSDGHTAEPHCCSDVELPAAWPAYQYRRPETVPLPPDAAGAAFSAGSTT